MNHPEAVGLYRYWKNGSEQVEVNPDPPKPEEAKPFHVVIQGKGWIPVSELVFARNETHAANRVKTALKECAEGAKGNTASSFGPPPHGRVLRELASGELQLTVRAIDVTRITAKVNWASNGGL